MTVIHRPEQPFVWNGYDLAAGDVACALYTLAELVNLGAVDAHMDHLSEYQREVAEMIGSLAQEDL